MDANSKGDGVASDIAAVSWNVHGDEGDVAALVDRIRNGDLLGRQVTHVVLLLQEVVRRSDDIPAVPPPGARMAKPLGRKKTGSSDLRATARSLGLNLVYVPSMRNGRGQEDRGNAILSTLPLDAVDAFELPLGRQRRVAVSATIRATPGASPLRFVSVHFDTAILLTRGGPARWRGRQARALVEWLGTAAGATVVGGDLNTWWGSDEPAVRELREAFPEAVDRSPLARTWRGPAGTENRLDYLFADGWGKSIEVHRIRQRFGSDHAPIYAWLKAPVSTAAH